MKNQTSNRIRICVAALMLAMVSTACGTKIGGPVMKIKTGSTQTVDIQVPLPATSSKPEVTLKFLAGELLLSPGDGEYLTSGSATFNAVEFKPKVEIDGPTNYLSHGDLKIKGIPSFDKNLVNVWDLQIANVPMSLNIWAGAYTGRFELGGLSLEKLTIDENGSDMKASFSSPNNVVMSSFVYTTGGSTMELKGLANANFEQMTFNSGAGDYTLSFDGKLQRDADVLIDSGVSTINIIIPEGVNARVDFDGGLSSVIAEGGWQKDGEMYSLAGAGPTITIKVKMGLGTLNLKTG